MPRSPLLTVLEADWSHRRDDPAAGTRVVCRWAVDEPALARYRDLVDLEAHVHTRTTPGVTVDAVFAALLRLTRRGDQDAGATVIALLLPALKRHRGDGGEDRAAALVAGLWQAIATHPLDRRPTGIAGALVYAARAAAANATSDQHTAGSVGGLDDVAVDRADIQRVDLRVDIARAAIDACVSADDLELVAQTRLGGWTITDLAADRAEAGRLRQRRRRTETRLADALAAHRPGPMAS